MPRAAGLARGLVLMIPAAFLALFYCYPVGSVIVRGLALPDLAPLGEVFGSPRLREVMWFTSWQAVLSTAATLAVGLPAASVVARLGLRVRRWVRALVTVPFVLPTVVVAGAFQTVFDRFGLHDGAIQLHHTVWAILLAHVFFNYAVVVRVVSTYWAGLDHRLEEQARVLGASRWTTWWEVTFPRLRPAVAAAAAVVFLFSFTSFGVVLILGGPRHSTIETEIYRMAVTRSDLSGAAGLAVVQLGAVLALILLSTWLERRRPTTTMVWRPESRPLAWHWLTANAAVMATLLGVPILALVERSVATGDGYGFDHYRALGERTRLLPASAVTAIVNSITFAVVATIIAMLVGLSASLVVTYGQRAIARVFDLGLTLPLGTSAVTIGFGILIALDTKPLDFRTSTWIVPVAHALVGVPFVIRCVVPVLRSIDPGLREAVAVLGADDRRVWREVDLPIAGRGLAVGGGFAFAVSLGEFGATSFLPRRADLLTVPTAIFRLLGQPGEALRGQAMALAVILMVLVAASVLLIESGRSTTETAF